MSYHKELAYVYLILVKLRGRPTNVWVYPRELTRVSNESVDDYKFI